MVPRRQSAVGILGVAVALVVTVSALVWPQVAQAVGGRRSPGETVLSTTSSVFRATVQGPGSLWITMRVVPCVGWPQIVASVDGVRVGVVKVKTRKQVVRRLAVSVPAGASGVVVRLAKDRRIKGRCDRSVFVAAVKVRPYAVSSDATSAPSPLPAALQATPTAESPTSAAVPTPTAAAMPPAKPVAGVPTGTTLRRYDGDLSITTDGTVVSGLDVYGRITVRANNVTIRDTRVRGVNISNLGNGPYGLVNMEGKGNTIVNSTLRADYPNPNWNGLTGYGFRADAVDVSNVVDTIMTYGDNVTVTNSYLHDNTQWAKDYTGGLGGSPSHSDGWQIEGGSNIVIRGNYFDNPQWTGIILTQNVAKSDNITIDNNVIIGGKCNVNISQKSRGPITGISVTGNVFGPVNTTAYSGGTAIAGCHIVATPTSTPSVLRGNSSTDGYPVVVLAGD